jgi:prevent-host-death family protein
LAWQLAEAKNKFSHVFTKTIEEGPQFVTRRDQEIVLLSKADYLALIGEKPDFIQHLLSIPKVDEIDFSRDTSAMRDYEW